MTYKVKVTWMHMSSLTQYCVTALALRDVNRIGQNWHQQTNCKIWWIAWALRTCMRVLSDQNCLYSCHLSLSYHSIIITIIRWYVSNITHWTRTFPIPTTNAYVHSRHKLPYILFSFSFCYIFGYKNRSLSLPVCLRHYSNAKAKS